MSFTYTTNYLIPKPAVGTEVDAWGDDYHTGMDIIDTRMKLNADAAAAKAPLVHTHIIADVTGLQAAIDGKAAVSHTHVMANITDLAAALALKAPLAAPALTGIPTAPTAALGTNTTQLSTTAFVKAAIDNIAAVDVPALIATEATVDTGGNLTVTNTHSGKLIRCTAAAVITFAADAAIPIGTIVNVGRYAAGEVTIAGAIMRSIGAKLRISDQYGGVSVKKIAAGEWWVWGDLKT
ncbi:MAG: hypothetical protein EHM33_00370 [Chloroflexi bacterium]|nr:MAG: hypothetical protein EHM33_00370 [Chloroflexota bacterium]